MNVPAPRVTGRCLWLFPLTYAVHIAEESLAGEGFHRWIHRVVGREIEPATFVAANLALEAAMIGVVRRATHGDGGSWAAPALGVLTATNGLGHVAGSVATRSYSPGAVSGACLWVPLGATAMLRSRRALPRRAWRAGIATGLLLQAGVALLGLALSRKPSSAT